MKRIVGSGAALALMGALVLAIPPCAGSAMTRAGASEDARYAAATLLPVGHNKARGALVIVPGITGLRLALTVMHLQPKMAYAVLIYAGSSCANSAAGTVQEMLPDVTADARGTAMLVTTWSADGVPPNGWYADLAPRQKDQTKTPGAGVVCGLLHQVGVNVPLAAPDAGYKDQGYALVTRHISSHGLVNMSSKGLGTEVAIYADKLAPWTTYTVAIIYGRCGGTGAVKYRLAGLQSDARGEAVAITYLDNGLPPEGLAVKVAGAGGRVATCGNFPGYGVTQPALGT